MAGCWTNFGRYVLICLNFVFVIVSLNVIALGLIVSYFNEILFNFSEADNSTQTDFYVPGLDVVSELPFIDQAGLTLLVLGGILFFLSFLPCCGAGCQWRPLLVLFVILMSILLLCEAVVGAMFLYDESPLHTTIKDTVGDQVKRTYDRYSDDPFTMSINFLNYMLGCCGIRGWEDFPDQELPPSCCNSTIIDGDQSEWEWAQEQCTDDPPTAPDSFYNDRGCYSILQDLILANFTLAAAILSSVLFLQLLEIVFACLLVRNLNEKNKVGPMDN